MKFKHLCILIALIAGGVIATNYLGLIPALPATIQMLTGIVGAFALLLTILRS
ncbi:MAG: hypothetical protein UW68_C0022G0015 [Candidatus Collierbacteria bacterium GW2011_GWB1_44_6]|uniref:Uncharacterized protein n=2 Tax=Candidatus Collieribacteriota TaxID=1752725 RepID=A0A0G1LVN6_9BACT|nr:MAG: hypothetical protein UV68_C0011G0005 [Candidatus Collierbacteria bacterium GW2011_GWC2_43_12]KKT72877.1 MAG: hypothetical protein UW68_C0022G0015 [Candidatus Collierbacteria bacterium GW2011_GWB1_44_6]KKT82324.1 MAG: hypothetical protein UW80_C0039G0002 [Microgenomates group bacterium GW2011_GWC1_44_9]